MSVSARAGDKQFVTTDFPVFASASHVRFVSAPENKARVFAGDEMQCLYIGTGVSKVAADRGKSGSKHVLSGTVFIERSPDIVDPWGAVTIAAKPSRSGLAWPLHSQRMRTRRCSLS